MSSTKRTCLICTKDIPKNSLITHIAEHLSYKRHKCLECSSQSALMEIMVDHQTTTNHRVQFDMKNWYLDRVCQLIYNDFEYAQKNGENSIREFGSVFGDKKRLTEMLRACELREEDDDIEVISTHEVQNTPIHSKMPIPVVRRSLPENNEQQPSTNSKMPSRSPMTTHIRCISVDSVQQQQDLQTNIHSNNATNSDKQQEECELIRPVGTLFNVQTAPADSSNEHTKGQTTEQILVELQRQITKGMERKMCKICHQMVDNDYKSQKEHIKERHLIGIDENKMRVKLEQCFKQEGHLLITNDLQCNICGRETKYRDTRYHHVSTMHTDYQWNCVYPSCDFMIRSKKHFNSHLNNWHKMNLNQLEGDAKDCYVMMNSDFEHKLTPLVRKCFPFDLTSPTSGEEEERKKTKKKNGLKNREDVLVDSLVSSFMPTVERPAINRSNSESSRKKQNNELKDEFESSSDSDCTDSEHKSKSKTPKEVQRGKKVDKVERTSSSTVKHQWTKNEDNAKTQPTPRSSAGPGSGNGSYYSSPKSYYQPRNTRIHERKNNYRNYHERRRNQEDCESPLKEPRHHEAKKQKIEKKPENIVYFRR